MEDELLDLVSGLRSSRDDRVSPGEAAERLRTLLPDDLQIETAVSAHESLPEDLAAIEEHVNGRLAELSVSLAWRHLEACDRLSSNEERAQVTSQAIELLLAALHVGVRSRRSSTTIRQGSPSA